MLSKLKTKLIKIKTYHLDLWDHPKHGAANHSEIHTAWANFKYHFLGGPARQAEAESSDRRKHLARIHACLLLAERTFVLQLAAVSVFRTVGPTLPVSNLGATHLSVFMLREVTAGLQDRTGPYWSKEILSFHD